MCGAFVYPLIPKMGSGVLSALVSSVRSGLMFCDPQYRNWNTNILFDAMTALVTSILQDEVLTALMTSNRYRIMGPNHDLAGWLKNIERDYMVNFCPSDISILARNTKAFGREQPARCFVSVVRADKEIVASSIIWYCTGNVVVIRGGDWHYYVIMQMKDEVLDWSMFNRKLTLTFMKFRGNTFSLFFFDSG